MQENEISVPDNQQQTETHSLKAMSFSEILDGMFSLYRKHFNLFFRMVVVYFFIVYVLDKITLYIIYGSLSTGNMALMFIPLTATTLIAILVVGALSYASAEVFLGRTITVGTAYQHAMQKFMPLFACYMIYIIVCALLGVTCIGLPFSIYLLVRWSQYSLPILIEDNTTMNALKRSGELVKNTWWRVCGIMLAMIIIQQMIQSILSQSFNIVFFLLTGISNSQDSGMLDTLQRMFLPNPLNIGWTLYAIQSFVTTAIVAITLPIITIGSTLLYFDLRIRKDAYDLEMQATQHGVESNNQS